MQSLGYHPDLLSQRLREWPQQALPVILMQLENYKFRFWARTWGVRQTRAENPVPPFTDCVNSVNYLTSLSLCFFLNKKECNTLFRSVLRIKWSYILYNTTQSACYCKNAQNNYHYFYNRSVSPVMPGNEFDGQHCKSSSNGGNLCWLSANTPFSSGTSISNRPVEGGRN